MTNQQLAIRDDMSLSELGNVFVASGFFQDTRQASQAIVKVLAGRELGFGPIASMTGVYVIQGRISMSANLLAAAIKRTGKYNFLVKKMTDEVCEIEYRERIDGKWEVIGTSTFTAADAKRAMTKNMDKFPRNMLYARAMSNGARWYCPDVFGGPVYTPEEMGADVTEDGEVIAGSFVETTQTQEPPLRVDIPAPEAASVKSSNTTDAPAQSNGNGNGHKAARPFTPEALKDAITKKAGKHSGATISDGAKGLMVGQLNALFGGDENKRHQFTKYLTGYGSTKQMPGNVCQSILDWIGSDDEMAKREANSVIAFIDGQNGQGSLLDAA